MRRHSTQGRTAFPLEQGEQVTALEVAVIQSMHDFNAADLAEFAGREQFSHAGPNGHEAGLHRLHKQGARLTRGRNDPTGLFGGEHRRFLTQDRLARPQQPTGPSFVHPMRQGEVDRIDVRIVHEHLMGAFAAIFRADVASTCIDWKLGGEAIEAHGTAAAQRHERRPLDMPQGPRKPTRDAAGAHDSPAQSSHIGPPILMFNPT